MKYFIFIAGLLAYIGMQFFIVTRPMLARSEPVEVDDAYSYILKAAEMKSDFQQKGPALSDLRHQFGHPTNDFNAASQRVRQDHRVFTVYNPAYSLALLSIHELGVSWNRAYKIIQVIGCLFIGFALAVWLNSLVGLGAAGCALLLMAPMIFGGQGLHYIVPTNISLGVAIVTWVCAVKTGRVRQWGMLLGSALMIGVHIPAGKLYVVLTVIICLLAAETLKDRRAWIACVGPLSMVIGAALLPLIMERPMFAVGEPPIAANYNYMSVVLDNIRLSLYLIKDFSVRPLLFIILFIIGVLRTPAFKRRIVFGELILFGSVLLASVFYSLPGSEGTLTTRVYIPLMVIMTAVLGHGVWSICSLVSVNLRNRFQCH